MTNISTSPAPAVLSNISPTVPTPLLKSLSIVTVSSITPVLSPIAKWCWINASLFSGSLWAQSLNWIVQSFNGASDLTTSNLTVNVSNFCVLSKSTRKLSQLGLSAVADDVNVNLYPLSVNSAAYVWLPFHWFG